VKIANSLFGERIKEAYEDQKMSNKELRSSSKNKRI
jgi:hypothetical protein